MSAMGQKRTHAPQQILFYHLVGELLEMQRYVEAGGFCGFEIDRQFKFGGLLYRALPRSVMNARRLNGAPLRTDDCSLSHCPALEAMLCGSAQRFGPGGLRDVRAPPESRHQSH